MERDITGRAVQQSAKIVRRVMNRVQQKVPLGPGNVRMTPEEMKKEVAKMRGEPLLRMAEMLGNEHSANPFNSNLFVGMEYGVDLNPVGTEMIIPMYY